MTTITQVEKVLEKLDEEISEVEELIEETSIEPKEVIKSLSKAIKSVLLQITDDVRVTILKYYRKCLKENKPVAALETWTRGINSLARIAFIFTAPRQSISQMIDKLLENYGMNPPSKKRKREEEEEEVRKNEYLGKSLSELFGEEFREIDEKLKEMNLALQKVWEAIPDSEVDAIFANLSNFATPTEAWIRYLQNVPGITSHRYPLLYAYAPAHRFMSFGKYRMYVGTAPREIYEKLSKSGIRKHWHNKAKALFYQTMLLSLRRVNPYYRKIFNHLFQVNYMKITSRTGYENVPYEELPRPIKAQIFFYTLKEATDVFAHHFWYMTRHAHGLEVHDPYVVKYLGHKPYYKPAIYDKGRKKLIDITTGDEITI